ncbi:hypothetical protein ACP70R_015777 [Stipagrostis hirtigluma subsp. patula]
MKTEEDAGKKILVPAVESSKKERPRSFPKKGSLIILIDDDGYYPKKIQQVPKKPAAIDIEDHEEEPQLKKNPSQETTLKNVASKNKMDSSASGNLVKKQDRRLNTKLYLAAKVNLTKDQKKEIYKIAKQAANKSPIYVINLKQTQLTSGLGFSKKFSMTLPRKDTDVMLMAANDDSFVRGKLKKYSNGRSYVTSGWGKFAKSKELKMNKLHAIQLRTCTSYPGQLCLTVFNLP